MWKDGKIPYIIEGFNSADRSAIKKAMDYLESVAGLE